MIELEKGQKDTLDRNPVKDTVYHTPLCIPRTLLDPSRPSPRQSQTQSQHCRRRDLEAWKVETP